MPLSTLSHVSLAAVSAVLPPGEIRLEDELRYFGGSLEKAEKANRLSGMRTRRVAEDGVSAADLCRQAAERLFAESDRDGGKVREEIGVVAFMSQSPDYLLPATASLLQDSLNLSPGCVALDMNSGCAGFVHGLWMLSGMIASGACEKALLLVGDTPARFLDPANRVVAPLFGDAGSAALLEKTDAGASLSFLLGNDGSGYEALIIPGGGSRIPQRPDEGPKASFKRTVTDANGNPWTLGDYGQLWMHGMSVFSFGVGVVPAHIRRHLELAGVAPGELEYLLLHQANKLMLETIAKKVGVAPEKAPTAMIGRYGNLGAASIPTLICEEFAGLPPGAGPERVLLCGFGAGLSWSSCLLSLKNTRISPVETYEAEEAPLSREERIAYWHEKFSRA